MREIADKEQQLQEYFNVPIAAPPHLVSSTLRRIRERNYTGALIGASALNLIVVLLLAFFVLAGPLFLFWKMVIWLVFCLFQAIAVALLVYNVLGSPLESSAH